MGIAAAARAGVYMLRCCSEASTFHAMHAARRVGQAGTPPPSARKASDGGCVLFAGAMHMTGPFVFLSRHACSYDGQDCHAAVQCTDVQCAEAA